VSHQAFRASGVVWHHSNRLPPPVPLKPPRSRKKLLWRRSRAWTKEIIKLTPSTNKSCDKNQTGTLRENFFCHTWKSLPCVFFQTHSLFAVRLIHGARQKKHTHDKACRASKKRTTNYFLPCVFLLPCAIYKMHYKEVLKWTQLPLSLSWVVFKAHDKLFFQLPSQPPPR
jgi:hypothetical protein